MSAIVVTGDSRGLGAAVVADLLESTDHDGIGLSRSETEQVDTLSADYPNRYHHLTFDLVETPEIEALYKDELKPRGPIEGLVNNAAIGYDDLVTNVDIGRLEQMMHVNVLSPIVLTKYVLRDMLLNRTDGALVHVSSVSTATGYKGLSMYAASKAALEGFSRNVAREWGERGIRSNAVVPGFMETDMTADLSERQRDRIYERTGLGEPTDIGSVVDTIHFLLSDDARSITGETVRIDSGTL